MLLVLLLILSDIGYVAGIIATSNDNIIFGSAINGDPNNNNANINAGNATYGSYIAGIIGKVVQNVDIVSVRNYGNIIGINYVAGIIGAVEQNDECNNYIAIGDVLNSGNITGTGDIGYVAGIIGVTTSEVTLTKVSNSGDVTSVGDYVAGVIGSAVAAGVFLSWFAA